MVGTDGSCVGGAIARCCVAPVTLPTPTPPTLLLTRRLLSVFGAAAQVFVSQPKRLAHQLCKCRRRPRCEGTALPCGHLDDVWGDQVHTVDLSLERNGPFGSRDLLLALQVVEVPAIVQPGHVQYRVGQRYRLDLIQMKCGMWFMEPGTYKLQSQFALTRSLTLMLSLPACSCLQQPCSVLPPHAN